MTNPAAMLSASKYLTATKYAGAKFEYGHPYNDAAYNLVYDAPAMAAKVTRYEAILPELECALVRARDQLQALIEGQLSSSAELAQLNAALTHLGELRSELAEQPVAA